MDAPRQAVLAEHAVGHVEVLPMWEHALSDLEGFDRIWILFWFDRADAPSGLTKVWPPRSEKRRGVFATRSPHRPNPIGMSAVRLERVEGLRLHVRDLDILDRTPVLDIKPYIPYADAFPDAKAGWLQASDPRPDFEVAFAELAEAQLAWLTDEGPTLRARAVSTLSLGPEPRPYRRIQRTEAGGILAIKAWRLRFEVERTRRRIVVTRIDTGYRDRDLARGEEPSHALHRAFVAEFGS